jgi:cytochrome c2
MRSNLRAVLLIAACMGAMPIPTQLAAAGDSGDVKRGARVIASRHCGSCHMIPGIRGAEGLVGPPLILFGRRSFIAGRLPNSPDNIARWVTDPQAVEPGTAMPALGLSSREARDVAAYLTSLR